jgi:hypothetical protein
MIMADKKLNEVPVVSDIVTIFGKRSNGEIVQIDKSNLATLLGELMKFFPIKGGIEPGTDLNTIGGAGIYNLSGEYANAPFSQSWGNLIVLSDGSKTQIVTEYTGSTFSIFTRGDNSRKWYKVNLTKDI